MLAQICSATANTIRHKAGDAGDPIGAPRVCLKERKPTEKIKGSLDDFGDVVKPQSALCWLVSATASVVDACGGRGVKCVHSEVCGGGMWLPLSVPSQK